MLRRLLSLRGAASTAAASGVGLGLTLGLRPPAADCRASSSADTGRSPMCGEMEAYIRQLQVEITAQMEALDGGGRFERDDWAKPATSRTQGGGRSNVMQNGKVFEKAGVNITVTHGFLPPAAARQMRTRRKDLGDDDGELPYFACGLSLVLHPHNPHVPTVHANYRYFEIPSESGEPGDPPRAWWFGGGSDLTPSYLYDEDAIHFHDTLAKACDGHDAQYFPAFKAWCDKYFHLPHRGEARGVGGIFFDDMDGSSGVSAGHSQEELFAFVQSCGDSFVESYAPIVERRKGLPYSAEQKRWQQMRRGRYVEFNLVWDRGTKFVRHSCDHVAVSSAAQVARECRLTSRAMAGRAWRAPARGSSPC